jgi:hypothetical protein
VNGHIHDSEKSLYHGKPFLIAGSLIHTQLRKEESGKAKCFWKVDTMTGEWEQVFLTDQRGFYFVEFKEPESFLKEMHSIISGNPEKKPVVKVSFPKEVRSSSVSDIEDRYKDSVVLSFKKETIDEKKFESKTLEQHKLSVEELGKKLLADNLARAGLDPRTFDGVFDLLVAGKQEEALNLMKEAAIPAEKPVLVGRASPAVEPSINRHTEAQLPDEKMPVPRPRQKTIFG